ncbi:unnamed protein product [Orchesella dallaii]|uniref:Multidrug resistance-associated protein 4 n=1 Tax=Orchesella dallaii TaxID=48710 RepID=A0ABP1PW82_9HEXA
MDFGGKKDVPNPREKANIVSRLFFLWIFPLFCKGAKQDLNIDDMYNAPKEDSSAQLGTRLGRAWEDLVQSSKKKNEKPKFYQALWKVFGGSYVFFGVGTLFDECIIRVAQPIFLRLLIRSFSDHSVTSSQQLVYAAGVCLTSLFHALLMHPISFGILHLGMKCRISTCSLIYRKTLRLSKAAQEQTPIGQLINLLSNDVNRFDYNVLFLPYLFIGPLQTIIFTYFLWEELGISCLAGTGFVMILMPLQYYIGKLSRIFRFRLASRADQRGKIMNEIIIAMRVIKIYAWELPFSSIIQNVRRMEVKALRKRAYLRSFYFSMFVASSKLVPYMTFFIYVMLGNQLTADKVFFALTVFNVVIHNMVSTLPSAAAGIGELIVATNRIEKFLSLEEQKVSNNVEIRHAQGDLQKVPETRVVPSIHMENVTARWTNNTRNNDLSQVTAGLIGYKLIMVVGPIGSGKTSFLQALLQELPISSGKCLITGRMAFASQEPWIYSGTLQQNILFGRPFDPIKYEEVVSACALESDFLQLSQGDMTILGERGITLSGGQKARISLARALYQQADIYLMDDPLSAVDSRVSRHIFDKCLKRYLAKSLRILVTHQLQYLPQADCILVFNQGQLLAQGNFQELMDRGIDFLNIITSESEESVSFRRASLTKLEETEKEVKKDEETRASHVEKMAAGSVSWRTYWKYFRLGNSYTAMITVFIGFIFSQLLYSATDWWLAYWTNSEEIWSTSVKPSDNLKHFLSDNNTHLLNAWNHSGAQYHPFVQASTHEDAQGKGDGAGSSSSRNIFAKLLDNVSYRGQNFYIVVYTVFVISVALATNLKAAFFFRYCMRISINIHKKMFSSLIRAPIKFFDENPSGRIMNRFSKDLSSMDENLPAAFIDVIEIFLVMIGVIFIVVLSNFYVIVPSVLLILSLWLIRGFYIKTARDVKRLEAITKSPLFTHLTASVQGLTTIRASKRQNILIEQFDSMQDIHSAAWFLFISSNRWFGIWLEMISVLFLASVTFSFLRIAMSQMSGSVGLAISSVLTLTGTFQWGMRQSAETENLMTSVERTIEYTKIEPEAELESKPEHKPPPGWPAKGNVKFCNVSLSYDNNTVLDNLSFEIKGREKIGIVGRTGAGKSSILSALFRLTEPSGDIFIDGVRINDVGLHDLRKNISIIPQDPVLFSGTVRYNLDPFDQFNDDQLWEVLEEVDLKHVVPALDWQVQDGGTNFSIGQRQLVCLARAILRQNKIIVMDEATANVDPQTDYFIQSTIRKKFADCTIIMIAHRLHSVVECDNVLVLENGQLQEYDHPHLLYKNPFSLLSVMSRHTGKGSYEHLKATAYNAYVKKFGPPEPKISQDSYINEPMEDIEAILPVTSDSDINNRNSSYISDTDLNSEDSEDPPVSEHSKLL